mmetsp:Transcript_32977/g.51122  ORF Transcript_32977/g.51122 Transcript_32977/m.51122 type:complete len:96 (-) Transcript_32977:46-333(-)
MPKRATTTRSGTKRTRKASKTSEDSSPPAEVYEVEHILGRRINKKKEEFLIKWKDYSYQDNSWEPADNLVGCDEAMDRFLQGPKARRTKPIKPDN